MKNDNITAITYVEARLTSFSSIEILRDFILDSSRMTFHDVKIIKPIAGRTVTIAITIIVSRIIGEDEFSVGPIINSKQKFSASKKPFVSSPADRAMLVSTKTLPMLPTTLLDS